MQRAGGCQGTLRAVIAHASHGRALDLQYLYEAGYGKLGKIGCTQPRWGMQPFWCVSVCGGVLVARQDRMPTAQVGASPPVLCPLTPVWFGLGCSLCNLCPHVGAAAGLNAHCRPECVLAGGSKPAGPEHNRRPLHTTCVQARGGHERGQGDALYNLIECASSVRSPVRAGAWRP